MISYTDRAESFSHPLAQRLLRLMDIKKTNLALSADVTTQKELLALADTLGPEICILKTHIDILSDFDQHLPPKLIELATRHQFLIFEDRKFADIGNTVQHQYQGGIYHIVDWADIINAHTLPGEGIIQGLKQVGLPMQRACLLLAQMSSAGNLLDADYGQATVEMAKTHRDFICGFIAQQRLIDTPDFIYMTPGVSLQKGQDNLGQRYLDPETAILTHGTDVIIIGRAIYQAPDPIAMAKQFRQLGWEAYLKRI